MDSIIDINRQLSNQRINQMVSEQYQVTDEDIRRMDEAMRWKSIRSKYRNGGKPKRQASHLWIPQ